EKFAQHQPLNRQSERYARGHRPQPFHTGRSGRSLCRGAQAGAYADRGPCACADRLHADDTTVPILARGKTDTGRIWTYVRDDRPFGGTSPPAALYYASRDRRQEHPERHLR
ncbi:MAG: IS66 family transposase, partial [Mesorhizobium sp.]